MGKAKSKSSVPAVSDGPPLTPAQQQELPLIEAFFAPTDKNESRTFELFDALPKYIYAKSRRAKDLTPITKQMVYRRRDDQGKPEELHIDVALAPAFIKKGGSGQAIYPGAREELVETAIRKMAVQQVVNTGLHAANQGGQIIRVTFTLYQLRKEMTSQGHGYKLSELKEALDVLSKAVMTLTCSRDRSLNGINSAVFSNLIYSYDNHDSEGERSRVSVDYHPLATDAIINMAFYPINYQRVMSLGSPLARWLVTRMSHRFRQATKTSVMDGSNYQISLETILNESGIARSKRLPDNILVVREALAQMTKENVLHALRPFEEVVSHAPAKTQRGRPAISDVLWRLYPSRQFGQEIIEGNVQMRQWRNQQPPGKSRQGHALGQNRTLNLPES